MYVGLKRIIFLILLFLSLFIFLAIKSQNEVLHEDEWFFIRRAEFFDLYFLKHDFNNSLWYGFHGIDQPFISYYFYGLTLHLGGINDIGAVLEKTNFEQTMPAWDAQGNLKQTLWKELYQRQSLPSVFADKFELIKKGRLGAVFLLTMCLIVIFFTFYKSINYVFALMGLGLFFLHPITIAYGKKALADQLLLLLFLLTPILGLNIIKNKSTKTIYLRSVLMGLLGGLAFGVKPNGILTLLFYYLLIIIFLFLKDSLKPKRLRSLFLSPLIAITSAVSIIYLLHPNLWNDPVNKFFSFFQFRWKIALIQAQIWPETSLVGKWLLKPQAFLKNLFYLPYKIDFFIFLIGFFILFKELFKKSFINKNVNNFVITFWNIFLMISFLIYLPLDWERYYWILVPGVIYFQLYGLKSLKNMILFIDKEKCCILNFLPKLKNKLLKMR